MIYLLWEQTITNDELGPVNLVGVSTNADHAHAVLLRKCADCGRPPDGINFTRSEEEEGVWYKIFRYAHPTKDIECLIFLMATEGCFWGDTLPQDYVYTTYAYDLTGTHDTLTETLT